MLRFVLLYFIYSLEVCEFELYAIIRLVTSTRYPKIEIIMILLMYLNGLYLHLMKYCTSN